MSLSQLPNEILHLILKFLIPKYRMGAGRNMSHLIDYIYPQNDIVFAHTFLSLFQTLKLVSRLFYHVTWTTIRTQFDGRMRFHGIREEIADELANPESFKKISWVWPWVKELNIRHGHWCEYLSQMNIDKLSNLNKVTVDCTWTFRDTGFTFEGTPHRRIIDFVKTNTEMQQISSMLETFRKQRCEILYQFQLPLPGRISPGSIRPGMILDASSLENIFVVDLYEHVP